MVSLHSDFLILSLDKRPMKHMGCIFFTVMALGGGIMDWVWYIYCWIERCFSPLLLSQLSSTSTSLPFMYIYARSYF